MPPILHDFLLIFIPLFVVVNPAGSVPLFIAFTGHYSPAQRRRIALRASTVAALVSSPASPTEPTAALEIHSSTGRREAPRGSSNQRQPTQHRFVG